MGSQSSRVAPAGVVPSVEGGVVVNVVNVARSENKSGAAIATMLLDQNDEIQRCFKEAASAAGAANQPQALPVMPSAFAQQIQEWAVACETEAYESEIGTRAHSFSVPMLVASHSGQSEKAQELMSDMEASLNEEVSSKKISPSTEAWMLGRLLAANCHLRADADGIAEKLRGVLDQILARRLAQPESLETADAAESWAWAYLMLYGDRESSDLGAWLKASRILWNSVDAAGVEMGNRMWVSTMALLAFSKQLDASCICSSPDPFARETVVETIGDILSFLKLDLRAFPSAANGGADPDLVGQHQLSLSDAMRQVPEGAFRAWAISLVKLAGVQADLEIEDLAEVFREAMESTVPGDLALGATTWAYAMYVAEWKRLSATAPGE